MIEVEVENFQSITKASFKIDGFTALVGRSNIGKSALVRALRNALTGAQGTDFVRHGPSCERRLKDQKKCRCQTTVRIQTPSVEIVWEKGDGVNRYTLTKPGEAPILYDKVGAGTPDFLRPEFSPVKVGDDQNLIQVSEQFDPIFLLNVSGSVVADVLSDVARLDDINGAIKLVVKDRKEAMSTRTVREKDVAELVTEAAKYIDLDQTVGDVARIESQHDGLRKHQTRVDQVSGFMARLEGLARGIRGLQAATKPELPNDTKVQETAGKAQAAGRFQEEWVARTEAVERLSGVEALILPDLQSVESALNRYQKVGSLLLKVQAIKVDYERGRVLAGTKDPDHDTLLRAQDQFSKVSGLLSRNEVAEKAIQILTSQAEAAEEEEAAALAALRELGMCPTCSQPIAAEAHLHLEAS